MNLVKKMFAVLMAFAFIFGTMSSTVITTSASAASFSEDMDIKVDKDRNTDKYGDQEVEAQVAPIIVWAAGVLAAAGLSWLAKKLYDYGAEWFCDNYGDYNGVTEKVCDVIG
ncbi:hypothetical protein JOC86_004270 [Bacillus pakistanensis]|uniref:Uncharacterized protein n=1 Tax=Rossellomorea pakistanensis TaxID=992288 RepID=A0ABS2NJJ4_9BACI|nr:hypothetical protein [Bacillus pakistanensis]MBM7587696.1 hypothetical protein [Bacillus pakistanensis]